MDKTRLKKVDRLIQKELSIIFQQNPLAEFSNMLISVTVVRISPDLSVARVYLSIFPSDDNEKVVELITERSGKIKYELGKRLRNQLRKIPDLKFFVDDSLDYAGKIDNLLK